MLERREARWRTVSSQHGRGDRPLYRKHLTPLQSTSLNSHSGTRSACYTVIRDYQGHAGAAVWLKIAVGQGTSSLGRTRGCASKTRWALIRGVRQATAHLSHGHGHVGLAASNVAQTSLNSSKNVIVDSGPSILTMDPVPVLQGRAREAHASFLPSGPSISNSRTQCFSSQAEQNKDHTSDLLHAGDFVERHPTGGACQLPWEGVLFGACSRFPQHF